MEPAAGKKLISYFENRRTKHKRRKIEKKRIGQVRVRVYFLLTRTNFLKQQGAQLQVKRKKQNQRKKKKQKKNKKTERNGTPVRVYFPSFTQDILYKPSRSQVSGKNFHTKRIRSFLVC